jgi:putative lipoic acid-binding regulatory protein
MAEDKFQSLGEKLNEVGKWPRVYLFKFKIKQSHKGNYLSVSAKESMLDADSIIKRYKKAAEIDGLMAL